MCGIGHKFSGAITTPGPGSQVEAVRNIRRGGYRYAKNQICSTIALWGVYPEVLRALAQKSSFFPVLFHPFSRKVSKTAKKS